MTFGIPNLSDTPYIDQAEPDAGDFAALAERNTGVISGCLVSAQGTPALAVDVSSGFVVVGGAPVTVAGGSVAVIAGEAQPRFDLVVVDASAVKQVIKGTASTNPAFPSFNPTTYCFLSAIYVRQSVSSIVATDIVGKGVTVPTAFRRVYGDDVTEFVSTANSTTSKTFKVMSGGEHRWMSSILSRAGDAAMSFATSLLVKAVDLTLPVLALQARSGTAVQIAAQHLLEIQSNGGSPIAYVNGAGQAFFDNIKSGSGLPESSVLGNKGDIYINRTFTSANAAVFIKTTDATTTGWVALAKYDPTATALATGAAYCWIGNPASPPAGSAYLNGSLFSISDPTYANIFAIIQYTYGGTVGVNARLPDWRDVSPMGAGTIVALGAKTGSPTTTQTTATLAPHYHSTVELPHSHPKQGLSYFWRPTHEPTWIRPYPSSLPPLNNAPEIPYMDIESLYFDDSAKTNVAIVSEGGGAPMTTLSPVVGTHWLVRL